MKLSRDCKKSGDCAIGDTITAASPLHSVTLTEGCLRCDTHPYPLPLGAAKGANLGWGGTL